MRVSVGIIAHNEERNIGRLLESLSSPLIGEIIVVSSSIDGTNNIVKRHGAKLIAEKKRFGKAIAINKFMKAAKNSILVLCSADIVPLPGAIDELCAPLKNRAIGIVASRPVPAKQKTLIGSIVELQWLLQHEISMIKPKFGEMIAFRRLLKGIDRTPVDEEYIAMVLIEEGYKAAYVPGAVVRNYGPKTYSDFIRQRRRIYCGHLELMGKGYVTSSLDYGLVLGAVWHSFKIRKVHIYTSAALLEAIGRLFGLIDYIFRRDHTVWEISETTKAE
jgi:poly-beta-1,6-N-acetyl-D-glucosamine synthase